MIDNKLVTKIHAVLSKEPKIKLAYVLGSVVSGRSVKESDFDLCLVVNDKSKVDYDDIYRLISHIQFPKDLDLSVVDKNSSPLFLFQIVSTGKCVFQKSDQEKINFEAFVLKNYYDTAHTRNIYFSYLKEKFSYAG